MDKNQAKIRLEKLIKQIQEIDYAYYVLDKPFVSDAQAIIDLDWNENFSYDYGEEAKRVNLSADYDYQLLNQTAFDVLFLPYKKINGVCFTDFCSGEGELAVARISDKKNMKLVKEIFINENNGDLFIH